MVISGLSNSVHLPLTKSCFEQTNKIIKSKEIVNSNLGKLAHWKIYLARGFTTSLRSIICITSNTNIKITAIIIKSNFLQLFY